MMVKWCEYGPRVAVMGVFGDLISSHTHTPPRLRLVFDSEMAEISQVTWGSPN